MVIKRGILDITANFPVLVSETHTKRQATQHDCMPSMQGDGNK
jgi:hypothetical protein